jgi:hypothetical protein
MLLLVVEGKHQRNAGKGIFACFERLSMNGKNKSLPDYPFFSSLNTEQVGGRREMFSILRRTQAAPGRLPMQHLLYFLPLPHGQGSLRPA